MRSVAATEAPLILTVDVGSSSARVRLYDGRGRAVEGVTAQQQYDIFTAADGTAQIEPALVLECAAHCIDAALVQAGLLATQIRAVAVTTFATSTLALNAAGQALTPLITYADTRAGDDALALRQRLDENDIHQRTGCLLRASYWPARLAWFRRAQPELWQATARWLTLGEYLELQLFGSCRVSFSAASWSGLLDRQRLVWDHELLGLLGVVREQLSPLVDHDVPQQGLVAAYATRWPALATVPWFPAVGDGAAANIGSGCVGNERRALTIGTTGALRMVQPTVPSVPPGLWCYRVSQQYALLGGATSEGGNVYAWLRDTLVLGERAEVEAALAALAPDSHGLTVLPFLAGERSPGWAGKVQATLHGLTLATTPLAILRASLEAVAYRFALIEQRLGQAEQTHLLVASGGALLQSPAWMQIFADVLGRPLVASAEPEATSRGVALLALQALGALPSLETMPASDGRLYEPNHEYRELYQAAMARQGWLYERLIKA